MQHHLNGDGSLYVVLKGEAGEKCVGRETVRVNNAPAGVRQISIHRREDAVDLDCRLGGYRICVVCVPHVRKGGIGDDVADRGFKGRMSQPPLPPVGVCD